MYDVIIRDGYILDGSGNPWFKSDIAVKDGRIVEIGCLDHSQAEYVINAEGLFVTPGFIDIHTHYDLAPFADPKLEHVVKQGVTTVVTGNCGISPFPVKLKHLDLLRRFNAPFTPLGADISWSWVSLKEFSEELERRGLGLNIAPLVGHGAIRIAAMGFEAREPSKDELDEMKELVGREMEEGAFGMSTGLIYAPAIYATTEELIELCKVVALHGGVYATHIRSEGDMLIESVMETLTIGEKSKVSVEVSHHKASGKANWGKIKETLKMLREARERGIEVTCDVYPYTAGMTYLSALLPPWVHEGGVHKLIERLKSSSIRSKIVEDMEGKLPKWENIYKSVGWEGIVIAYSKTHKEYIGKSISEISRETSLNPFTILFNTVADDDATTLMIVHTMNEEDVRTVISDPLSMIGSDSWLVTTGKPHPRFYGTYPRVIAKYVREYGVLRLEEAIRKMTSLPASKLSLWNRGLIRPGFYADIVIFNYEKINDKATFKDPIQFAEGINYVLINGEIVIYEGEHTGKTAGKVLRKT
jgi:N-acyl-D-amino-acid deacylase